MAMDIDNKQLERDIENALRARGLKLQIQEWEAERKQRAIPKLDVWSKIRRTVYAVSVAAITIGIVVTVIPKSSWQSTYKQAYAWCQQQYAQYFQKQEPQAPITHQYSTETLMAMALHSVQEISDSYYEQDILGHENLVHEAVWQIIEANYNIAEAMLENAQQLLDESDANYKKMQEEIDYLIAICYLGQGLRSEAKEALQDIAQSDSEYRIEASTLVEKIK
jgi:hypothetical protein